MPPASDTEKILNTSAGDFPLNQYCLRKGGKEWKILHVGSVLSKKQEAEFLLNSIDKLPFGVTLWTAAIALAHEIDSRNESFKGARVLELGSGTGLPGIVAASCGARVVQTDRNELALALCRRNLELNNIESVEHRLADWADWQDAELFDWIIGSDILYSKQMHSALERIFENNLSKTGRVLLSDPFRAVSLELLEKLEGRDWAISMNKWSISEQTAAPRPIGVFEMKPPRAESSAH
jgi:predicted nicotinamide N-methyase